MNNKTVPYLFVLLTIVLRLIPHIPNAAPIGALALLLGATLPKKTAIITTALTLLITDYFIGFHSVIVWVYGSYALIALVSKKMNSMKIGTQITYSLIASLLFYVITNFGVWMVTTMYEKNITGLIASYTNALPFLRNTLFGDLLYTVAFFALYSVITKKVISSPSHLPRRTYANSL